MIDFDNIEDWAPKFSSALQSHIPEGMGSMLLAENPKYIEDARDFLLNAGDRAGIINAALGLLHSENVAAYHGSRLTDEELESIKVVGLLPLSADHRRQRLLRALSQHPNWPNVGFKLDGSIHAHGNRGRAGQREGQVHFTLSKSGLQNGFNHYLTHGSEFDQHVAHDLLGADGAEFLARDGKARIIRVLIPGEQALKAAHPYFTVDDLLKRGEVPNVVSQFLESWSFKMAHPTFRSSTLKADCGLVFHSAVPSAWIEGCETLDI